MKRFMRRHIRAHLMAGIAIASLMSVPLTANGQDVLDHPIENSEVFNGTGWLLGLGVLVETSAFKDGDKQEVIPLPYIAYDWEHAHLGVDGFSYDLFEAEDSGLSLTAHLQPRWSFTAPQGSEFYKESDYDTTLDAGLSAEFGLWGVTLEADYMREITSKHEGWEATAELSTLIPVGDAAVELGAGVRYRDKKLTEFIYAPLVRQASASGGAFKSSGKAEPYLDMTFAYPIGRETAFVAFAEYSALRSEVKNNPLINENAEADFGMVLVRRF